MVSNILFCLALLSIAVADRHAIIIGPRNKFPDYGVQSESCRMYKDLVAGGVKPENIILMSTKRVSYHRWNPWPGQLFTDDSPDAPGKDYHHGCIENIDYEEEDMRGPVVLSIMRGDVEQVRNLTGKANPRVLQSTENDEVMFYLTSHGGPGSIAVGNTSIHVEDFLDTIQYMHQNRMYKHFLVLLEACYSGSIFKDLPKDINVYAISSTDPEHESWESHCPPYDSFVNGKKIGACLSCYWDNSMEWFLEGGSSHTLDELHEHSHAFVAEHSDQNTSHWGDIENMGSMKIADFMGEVPFNPNRKRDSDDSTKIPKSQAEEHLAKWRMIRSNKDSYYSDYYHYQDIVYENAKREIEAFRLAVQVLGEQKTDQLIQATRTKHIQLSYSVDCVRELSMKLIDECYHSYPFAKSTIDVLKQVCAEKSFPEVMSSIDFNDICL